MTYILQRTWLGVLSIFKRSRSVAYGQSHFCCLCDRVAWPTANRILSFDRICLREFLSLARGKTFLAIPWHILKHCASFN
ncbi:MAG: hypothetical protein F6K55_37705 [Moorea sp. SIO4A3]|nr:hypothetical protein [Moorena sp. SIO4A3]